VCCWRNGIPKANYYKTYIRKNIYVIQTLNRAGHPIRISVPKPARQSERSSMEKLMEILKSLHPEIDYEICDTLIDDNIIDSFDIVTLISEINEEFDVAIPAEEIIPKNFNSAQALWQLTERLLDE
jgi:D-alanine--poly(phosphoribitol) ligase subunit 2